MEDKSIQTISPPVSPRGGGGGGGGGGGEGGVQASIGSSVSSFFNKLTQTVFVVRQKVMETLGQEEGTVDPDTQKKIDKLNAIVEEYDSLTYLAAHLSFDVRALSEDQKLLGDFLYECSIKEENEKLASSLQYASRIHRELEKKGSDVSVALNKLTETIFTFKSAAISDTLLNLERYTDTRQQYDAHLKHLEGLVAAQANPDSIAAVNEEVERSKALSQKLSEDLSTKVVLLNAKRLQDLRREFEHYMTVLKQYYVTASQIF